MSQADAILDALQQGRNLTHLDALREFGCARLAARVEELRRLGHPIQTAFRHQGRKKWAEYTYAWPADGQGRLL